MFENTPKIGRPLFCPKHVKHMYSKNHFVRTPDKTSSFADLFALSKLSPSFPTYICFLFPVALAFVSYGCILVRFRVRNDFLLNGGLDKPPSRLATLAIRVLITLALLFTKAGCLQLSSYTLV